MKNIVLIGFMGTGKTTVGRRLALRLGLEFIDTDAEIERVAGKTIQDIFARHGLIRFRSEEALVIKRLSLQGGRVVATGGGAVLDSKNVDSLKKNGVLVRLTAPPEVIVQRVGKRRNRPLLNHGGALLETVQRLMREREEIYGQAADFTVDTGALSKDETVERIVSFLRKDVD
ncbi:shikimate kinase I [Desulfocucumis palustris]|uniref:Shikimate kinase n=1 Tax=Desulfocucumis palustris TaxID=1898651 RepID=A0A2L2XDA2_9FIRM|nr:shikimate kinase [Desulfocucumis palustris]GBF34205.1 shikimate kinase I [Desulfocucumis palustris]